MIPEYIEKSNIGDYISNIESEIFRIEVLLGLYSVEGRDSDAEYSNKTISDCLKEIKRLLNKIFNDSICKEVLYTSNTDNMFFGIKVLPVIDADDIYDYVLGDENQRLGEYIVELDSKLFEIPGIDEFDISTIMIHDIEQIVGDSSVIDTARNVIDAYMAENKDYIKISDSIHYKEILAYGLKDFICKANSIMYIGDKTDLYSNEFIHAIGRTDVLSRAYDKIRNNNIKMYENCECSKTITLRWALDLYKHIRTRRVGSMNVLARAKLLTGSRLEKIEIDNVIKRIKHIDDNVIIESGLIDTVRTKIRNKLRKSRLNTLAAIDSKFYELNMMVRNVEDENDALYIMRQVSNSISIVSDYIESGDCDDYERDKWNDTLQKYLQLREKLSKTMVYKAKNYGLFVNYPDIVENRY